MFELMVILAVGLALYGVAEFLFVWADGSGQPERPKLSSEVQQMIVDGMAAVDKGWYGGSEDGDDPLVSFVRCSASPCHVCNGKGTTRQRGDNGDSYDEPCPECTKDDETDYSCGEPPNYCPRY